MTVTIRVNGDEADYNIASDESKLQRGDVYKTLGLLEQAKLEILDVLLEGLDKEDPEEDKPTEKTEEKPKEVHHSS